MFLTVSFGRSRIAAEPPPRHLYVGDKTLTTCPPSLNKSLKKALLKEIKEFKEKDAQLEAEKSARGGPSLDAYNAWLDQNGGHEPIEANPDVLSENDGLIYSSSKKDSDMARLLTEVRQLFSKRELQAWNLVKKHNMSYREAADLLNISPNAVYEYVQSAKAKFIKFLEEQK